MNKANRFSRRLKNRFNEISEISEELTMGLPKIVILAKKECLIENYKGIIEYENQKIRLMTISGEVIIEGNNLHINEIGEGEMIIKGSICRLELEGDE